MRSLYPNELTHYGILGMKWGVRRYQNADGTLTEAGKKRYRSNGDGEFEDEKGKRRYDKDSKSQRKADEKLRKKITDAVAVGDVDSVYALRKNMTSDELKEALNRVKTLNDLYDMTPEQRRRYARRELIKNTAEAVGNVGKTVKDAVGIYNSTVDVVNLFNRGEKKMRKIGEDKPYVRPDIQNLINLGAWDTLYKMRSELTSDEIKVFEEKAKVYDSMYDKTTAGRYEKRHSEEKGVRPWVRDIVNDGNWESLYKHRDDLTADEIAFAKVRREQYNKIFSGVNAGTDSNNKTQNNKTSDENPSPSSSRDYGTKVPGSGSNRFSVTYEDLEEMRKKATARAQAASYRSSSL